MDTITREDISPELTSPLSPKRLRIDCTQTNNHSRFDFPELLTFRTTIGSPSTTSTLQKSAGLVCTAVCEDIEDGKPPNPLQDTKLVVSPITKLTTSHTENVNAGKSNACCFAAERNSLLLVKDEQPPVNETDKLSSYLPDDAGEALAESHTSKKASADTSSHPDCDCLGKSLEDEPPGGCNLPAGNEKDGRQVQSSVSQIQEFIFSSSDEEVRCLSDYTCEDTLRDTEFCNTWSQTAVVKESNQKRSEVAFSENILLCKEKEDANSPIFSNDYADSESFYSIPKEEASGSMADILELQICVNENVAACDGQTKGQVNETGMSENSIPSAAEWAEGSIVSYDVVLGRNIGTETASLEADDFCGAKGTPAAGEMIAKAGSETADHTIETPMPARISQEPAEGDNDAGPFGVIDPAIWSESDGLAEEKHCNSESTVGVELSPSVKVCEIDIPLCPDVRPSQQVPAPHQIRTDLCKEEKEDYQSYKEPQARCITIDETHQKTGNGGSRQWKSHPSRSQGGPAKPPTAGDEILESHDTVAHHSTEQDQSACPPINLDNLMTQVVEYLWTEIAGMEGTMDIKERGDTTSPEMKSGEHGTFEHSADLQEKPLQQHEEETSEISIGDLIHGWAEGETSNFGNKLVHIDVELENNLELLCDHPYSAVTPKIEGTTEKKGSQDEEQTDEFGSLEMFANSRQKRDTTVASLDECISAWIEGNMSKSGDELILSGQHEQTSELSGFPDCRHRPETDDLLAFAFPPSSDAVVPGPRVLSHSQNDDKKPFICSDRFSPLPSAFSERVLGVYDTFEKIQLSLDDDGVDDAGLSSSPLLTSLPRQLLKTPQQQLHHPMPEAEGNEHKEVPREEEEEAEEEEVERFKCHTDNMANGLSSSDYSCDELTNFISAAHVPALGWPEQKPYCESACNSSVCFQDELKPQSQPSTVSSKSDSPASDVNDSPKFEMKKQFDKVLKELNLFFDVSRRDFASDSTASSPEQSGDVTEAWESNTSEYKERPIGHLKDTSSDGADEDHRLDVCGSDPVVSHTPGSHDGEQEVPLGGRHGQEASVDTAEKHTEPRELEQKGKMWSPSFMCQPFLEQLSHRPAERPRRLEPLRTCTRPLRVGLSKRAKTKHLHRPHPYK